MQIKQLVLFTIITIYAVTMTAQSTDDHYGIKGGLNVTFFNVDQQNLGSYTTTEKGLYGGIFIAFTVDDFLSIQPEVLFISVGDFNFLNLPLYARYKVAKNVNILAGPSVNYFFNFTTSRLKIGADISSSYDISDFLDAHIKFALGLDELAPNGLFVGLALKL